MSNTKNTQRALVSSAIAILLCFAMLIGTTFAWFTDSKSTTVNSIDSGTLKIALEDANGKSVVDRSLAWQKAEGHEDDEILWEPGCTYNLEPVTIRNAGKLALKYTVEISGILSKDQELNKAIDWTITVGEGENAKTYKVATFEGTLLPGENSSDTFTITGHMREDAGNEYQDKHIDGVAIKVVATQLPYEYDSYGPDYDETAEYPVSTAEDVKDALKETGVAALLNDVTLGAGALKPTTTVVSISAVDEPVTVSFESSYGIAFTPVAAGEEYFANNDEFTLNLSNVTLVNGEKGKTSVVFGQFDDSLRLTGKTFNVNGGTFESHSAMTNGAISIAAVSDSTINISDATFIAYKTNGSQYASYLTLSDQAAYGAATGNTVNFTSCTFLLEDGTVIDPVALQTSNPSLFARLFWGINTNTVNFS